MIWAAETGGPSSSSSSAAAKWPPGTKFVPTDRELIGYYLYNHIQGTLPPSHYSSAVSRRDLYGDEEPWEIWRQLQSCFGEPGDVYLFTDLKKKAGAEKGQNFDRKVGRSGGSWHGEDTGTKFTLVRRCPPANPAGAGWIFGIRKRYSYRTANPNFMSEKAKWILHEYSLSKDPKGKDICSKVLCLLRNNDSPSAYPTVAAARSSALAAKQSWLQGYSDKFARNLYKRPRIDTTFPAQSQQLPPSSSTASCYPDRDDREASCSNPPPDTTTESSNFLSYSNTQPCMISTFPAQCQPPPSSSSTSCYPDRDDRDASCSNNPAPDATTDSPSDYLSNIDFESCIDLDEIDWSFVEDDGTTTSTEAQSVLDYIQDFEPTKIEEQEEQPLCQLPPPPPPPTPDCEPAKPVVVDHDRKGKEIMVSQEGDRNLDSKDGIVVPPACENGGSDYGSSNHLQEIWQGFGGGEFSDLFDMELPRYFYRPCESQGSGSSSGSRQM